MSFDPFEADGESEKRAKLWLQMKSLPNKEESCPSRVSLPSDSTNRISTLQPAEGRVYQDKHGGQDENASLVSST